MNDAYLTDARAADTPRRVSAGRWRGWSAVCALYNMRSVILKIDVNSLYSYSGFA